MDRNSIETSVEEAADDFEIRILENYKDRLLEAVVELDFAEYCDILDHRDQIALGL